jgi:protein-disulfide isomerase
MKVIIPRMKKSHLQQSQFINTVLMLLLTFGAGLITGYFLWGRNTPQQAAAPAPQQPAEVRRYAVEEGNNPSVGRADAPITIIEFSDYECFYCRKWFNEVLPRLLAEYPDEVRLVYRDFPLTSIHPNAVSAAAAANCAHEQERYWEFHDLLFSMRLGLDERSYFAYATELGLDMTAFDACLKDGRAQAEVQADYAYGLTLGVQSTPTFFINGIALVGAQGFEVFQQIIEKELAGEFDQ